MQAPIHIVWFKRDLRIHDHAPLLEACRSGQVLPVFAWEPAVVGAEDFSRQHQQFVHECLAELDLALRGIGLNLLIWPRGMMDCLTTLRAQYQIAGIWSHEETGNGQTYQLDKAVAEWCRVHGVSWIEFSQNGVVRRLKDRNRWNGYWEKRMAEPVLPAPSDVLAAPAHAVPQTPLPLASGRDKPLRQRGGRTNALELFESFLQGRAAKYRPCMSSPLTAGSSCSRISPYLAWGTLSMREVVQATRARRLALRDLGPNAPKSLLSGLTAFESRLHWHCHFMQKLESEPALEFENLHHAHDGIRESALSAAEQQKRLLAWQQGETGWPLIDACMAMLRETGWLNFRMRAMLMSTASYLYWLHWRKPGLHLAREFLDYEPGIHWPQVQMQSGTTGINALRIYNPVKQAKDQDPTGAFVRHWLPSLRQVPDTWIFQPWLMPVNLQQRAGCMIGRNYPAPILEIESATREARARLLQVRRDAEAKAESRRIVVKHGSRKGMPGSVRDHQGNEIQAKRQQNNLSQLSLFE